MAQWSENPSYTELENIMVEKATRQVGLTAEQFNKVLENIQYLKNLYDLYKVELGTVTTNYAAPGTPFDVQITHRQSVVNGDLTDFLDFVFTVATPRITTSASSEGVPSSSQAIVTVTQEPSQDGKGYNFDFDFKIPKGEVGYAECTDNSTASGVVNVVLEHEHDKTYTSSAISRINLSIPSTISHGFFAGINFKVGNTASSPTQLNVVNNSEYPLKLMRRGTTADRFDLTYGKTVMLVANCDGINVYCNLIEV